MNSKNRIFLLLIFLFGYLFLGAYIFTAIESSNEKEEKQELSEEIQQFIEQSSINRSALNSLLLKVEDLYLKGYSLNSEDKWDLPNSFFFSTTIVTTIGYGHMSPTTSAGRTACIIFALFGIPLNAWLLSELSEVFKIYFRRMALTFSELLKVYVSINSEISRKYISWGMLTMVVYTAVVLVPAFIFWCLEGDWNYEQAHYYCFISLSTIGFGDFVATTGTTDTSRWIYKLLTSFYLTTGLAFLAVLFNAIQMREQKRAHSLFNSSLRKSSKCSKNGEAPDGDDSVMTIHKKADKDPVSDDPLTIAYKKASEKKLENNISSKTTNKYKASVYESNV